MLLVFDIRTLPASVHAHICEKIWAKTTNERGIAVLVEVSDMCVCVVVYCVSHEMRGILNKIKSNFRKYYLSGTFHENFKATQLSQIIFHF